MSNLLDKAIGYFAPALGMRRLHARATMQQIEQFTGDKAGYDAGEKSRLTKGAKRGVISENALPREKNERIRGWAQNLVRNNPHARKIIRTLQAKVIGGGMTPQSQAVDMEGKPDVEFRKRVAELWSAIAPQIDSRGVPGRGGQHLTDIERTAIAESAKNGDTLYRFRNLTSEEQTDRDLVIPLQIQPISSERLAEGAFIRESDVPDDNTVVHGIELRPDGKRAAYWILDKHPSEGATEATRVPADQIVHSYVCDDVDQVRGVSWFAPALFKMQDTGDYEFNELTASKVAACVTLAVKMPTGQTQFGVNQPDGADLTDVDGNPITAMQPGQILNLGKDGSIDGFNPMRPGSNVEPFVQHLTRSTAAALPGIKGSTLTGDYRRSSFSSERSADNDAWPELEGVQNWFACCWLQPLFDAVVKAAISSGYFSGLSESQFSERQSNYLEVKWQGPVARSINPKDDATAAGQRIANGISSPQIETAKVGTTINKVLQDVREFMDLAKELKIPQHIIDSMLGIETQLTQTDDIDEPNDGEDADEDADAKKIGVAA